MSRVISILTTIIILVNCNFALTQTLDEYISRAEKQYQSGGLKDAVRVMEEALEKFPDQSSAHSYLGFYGGMRAGSTQNFMEAGELIGNAYNHLNKAVELDPKNPVARFHRGLMGINVPKFLNKLDEGIRDLEILVKLSRKSPEQIPSDLLVAGYNYLGDGYYKKKENSKAIKAWERIIKLAPNSEMASKAEMNIAELSSTEQKTVSSQKESKLQDQKYTSEEIDKLKEKIENEPNNYALKMTLGQAYIKVNDYEKAKEVLYQVITNDSTNLKAYKLLIEAVGEIAGRGYDENIYDDTNYRTELAFEVSELIEKAVALAPDDMELRLIRGSIDVTMPFFVGKLDQGMEDLNYIINSKADQEIKAEAMYWLGVAYKKKAITNWIRVITEYPGEDASQDAFLSMRPSMEHLDITEHKMPFVAIDFVLGFQDELAPQTVIWIEDTKGNFVKTVYVSGFSGYAKENQVNLPIWSNASDFIDVDGVTAASIDLGHHIYVWDIKDYQGNRVPEGEYKVNIEVAYWPSMQYQMVSAPLSLSSDNKKSVVEEGNLIPYVEIKYYGK